MTLEEAQEQIVNLTEQVTNLEAERDSLSNKNNELTAEVEKVRNINQKYFEKLTAQTLPEDKEPEPDEPEESLVDFAKTLSI